MWYLVVDHIVQEMPIKVKMSRYIHSYHYYLRQTSTLSAEAIGRNNVALSAKSEWSKENNQHNFVELLAFYRHQLLPVNPSSIAAVKDAATYDTW